MREFEGDLPEIISGNIAYMEVKSPGSDNVGYDLNMAITPCRMNVAKRGSCLKESRVAN